MQKIIPHLWFDTEAKDAVALYTSLFPSSEITHQSVIHNVPSPSGDSDILSFTLNGQPFMAINAGPIFKPNPSVSFMVNFDPSKDPEARKNLDTAWEKLSAGGKVLMELNKYPFSEYYGWIQDKYGFSWQLILTNPNGEERPFIIPSLMFTKQVFGRAQEAMDFYCSVFIGGKRGTTARYPQEMGLKPEGAVMFADFNILNTWIAAMDGAGQHDFIFNEAISLLIPCETQDEIDYYWEKLSADPRAEQCGWIKDKFGLSWQIHPQIMDEMMKNGTQEQIDRVTQAFMPMKKFDIETLKRAYEAK